MDSISLSATANKKKKKTFHINLRKPKKENGVSYTQKLSEPKKKREKRVYGIIAGINYMYSNFYVIHRVKVIYFSEEFKRFYWRWLIAKNGGFFIL